MSNRTRQTAQSTAARGSKTHSGDGAPHGTQRTDHREHGAERTDHWIASAAIRGAFTGAARAAIDCLVQLHLH